MTASITRASPYFLGVSGGSGSGKTYFVEALIQSLGLQNCQLIGQDNFYFDQSSRFDYDGGSVNFDHPDSIDFDQLVKTLQILRTGQDTEIPIYDFVYHKRQSQTLKVFARPIILIDGILIFHPEKARACFDEKVFFATPESLRFERRLRRDVEERGRKPEGVRQQFLNQVKPMHDLFVEPTKAFADRVICETGDVQSLVSEYTRRLRLL